MYTICAVVCNVLETQVVCNVLETQVVCNVLETQVVCNVLETHWPLCAIVEHSDAYTMHVYIQFLHQKDYHEHMHECTCPPEETCMPGAKWHNHECTQRNQILVYIQTRMEWPSSRGVACCNLVAVVAALMHQLLQQWRQEHTHERKLLQLSEVVFPLNMHSHVVLLLLHMNVWALCMHICWAYRKVMLIMSGCSMPSLYMSQSVYHACMV